MSFGVLYVVATPIGNLGDASARALEVLRQCNLVACEDTRVTRTLLARFGIATPMTALHEHNEREASASLLEALLAGRSVALVSDAGTPAVSDPGARLVELAHRSGIRVSPVPGPSAVAAAFSASGFADGRYLFAGFLPAAGSARREALDTLEVAMPVVLYEAPHRVARTIEDLVARFGASREIVIAREMTKKFEDIARMPLGDAPGWLKGAAHREQGEFVLVLAPGQAPAMVAAPDPDAVLQTLLEALKPSEAARIAAKITGAPKNALYRKALAHRK